MESVNLDDSIGFGKDVHIEVLRRHGRGRGRQAVQLSGMMY